MSEQINNAPEEKVLTEKELSQQMQVRREKLAALQEAGKDPFEIVKYPQDTHTDEIINNFDEMEGKEGILVASKVADRVGITRSVIVNALRKLESAGVIESRSSGMKGTYIKIQNDLIIDELNKLKGDQ